MAQLLVIEDDEKIGSLLESGLRLQGYDVCWERTGRAALRRVATTDFDLVLLDLGLPDLDGVEVCRQLRVALPAMVVVMLTARTQEMDVIVGLEAGADDYLTKPVRLSELLARLRAHLRRAEPVRPLPASVQFGDLLINVVARRVTAGGRDVPLRPKEFDLLARLAAEPDSAISRETLMADVWDENWFGSTKTLDVHLTSLRRKLADAAEQDTLPRIVTVRGHGYRLEMGTVTRDDQ